MDPAITSLSAIERDADVAAQRCIETSVEQFNPELAGTEAAKAWDRFYNIALLKHSAAKVEAGA